MIPAFRDRWHQMSSRERSIVLVGGIVAGLSLLIVLVVDPLWATFDRLGREAVRKEKAIKELALLSEEYRRLRDRLEREESRMPSTAAQFSLMTFMEGAATAARVREHITGMQPQVQTLGPGYQETAVDLRLDGVHLHELLSLLVTIEQAPYALQVRHLQVRPKFDNPVHLDATIRVLSYAKS